MGPHVSLLRRGVAGFPIHHHHNFLTVVILRSMATKDLLLELTPNSVISTDAERSLHFDAAMV